MAADPNSIPYNSRLSDALGKGKIQSGVGLNHSGGETGSTHLAQRHGRVVPLSTLSPSCLAPAEENKVVPYAGSTSCRGCHERYYQLWSTSMHGLAKTYTPELAKARLPQERLHNVGLVRAVAAVER